MLVVGMRESEEGTVAIRTLGEEHQKVMKLEEALSVLHREAMPPDMR